MNDSSGNLDFLWAYHTTPTALEQAPAIRHWLLPVASRLDVLAVAPVTRPMMARVLPLSQDRKDRELQEARRVAQSGITALGSTDVPLGVLTGWGDPGREIAAEAGRGGYDVVVMGSSTRGGNAGVSATVTDVLDMTQRSVFVARHDRDGPVLIMATAERWFRKALESGQRLRIDRAIPITLIAVLEPARPFGGMLLSFSEHVREQEQALHDVKHRELQSAFTDGLEALSTGSRVIRTLSLETERRDWTTFFDELSPSLVVVGDVPAGAHARHPESIAARVVAEAPCSVLVAR